MTRSAQLRSWDTIRAFITAGNAHFTLKSLRTGDHITYKAVKPYDAKYNKNSPVFILALTGTDNMRHYRYFAFIDSRGILRYGENNAKLSANAKSVRSFFWFYSKLLERNSTVLENQIQFYHVGKCGKCGRRLTRPDSIQTGFGPYCAKALRQ